MIRTALRAIHRNVGPILPACATLLVLASALPAAAAARECEAPDVAIAQSDPTRATLTWRRGTDSVGYFLQYSTGKMPSQIRLEVEPGQSELTAELTDLRPGITYTIEFCEAYAAGACPGPNSDVACNTLVTVPTALARPGVVQPDPDKAVCEMQQGAYWIGELVDAPERSTASADTAEACCQMCAQAQSNLPYSAQCAFFVFDSAAHECRYYREVGTTVPSPGGTAGTVVAFPRPRR